MRRGAFPDLVARARALAGNGRRAVLGIAGPPGAGKTTLAVELVAALAADAPDGMHRGWVAHVPMDGFHLADVELDRLGLRDRKGAPDTFDAYGYAASIGVHRSTRLIVTEGNYLLLDEPRWAPVRELLSEVWYADLEPGERLRRLVERHVRFGKEPAAARAWATGTDERNAELIAATRSRADLIVPSEVLTELGAPPS
jgi:pantothenate kinase